MLFCFDFDDTLVNAHFHSKLAEKGFPSQSASEQVINSLIKQFGVKNQVELKECMQTILKEGHALAITSFTMYPEVAVPTLKAIGLLPQEINQVLVVGGFPENVSNNTPPMVCTPRYDNRGNAGHSHKKEQHIGVAMKQFGISDPSCVVLIDDSPANIQKANQSGHVGLLVPKSHNPNPSYLEQAKQLALNYSLRQSPFQHQSQFIEKRIPDLDLSQAQNLHQLAALVQSYPHQMLSNDGRQEVNKSNVINVINYYIQNPQALGSMQSIEHRQWMQSQGITRNYGLLDKMVELGKKQHEDNLILSMISNASSLEDLARKIENCNLVLRSGNGQLIDKAKVANAIRDFLREPEYMANMSAHKGWMQQNGITRNYGLVDKIVSLGTMEYARRMQQSNHLSPISHSFNYMQKIPLAPDVDRSHAFNSSQKNEAVDSIQKINERISSELPDEYNTLKKSYLRKKSISKIGLWSAKLHSGAARTEQMYVIATAINTFRQSANNPKLAQDAAKTLYATLGEIQKEINSSSSGLNKLIDNYKSKIEEALSEDKPSIKINKKT